VVYATCADIDTYSITCIDTRIPNFMVVKYLGGRGY